MHATFRPTEDAGHTARRRAAATRYALTRRLVRLAAEDAASPRDRADRSARIRAICAAADATERARWAV